MVELSDGRLISIQHRPTPDGGWVATHQDVTEEHRRVAEIEAREREAALQNMRFDAAINNIKHGLCMFDGQKRLVICNGAYAEMYDLPETLTTARHAAQGHPRLPLRTIAWARSRDRTSTTTSTSA